MELHQIVKPPRRALALWRVRALLLAFLPAFLCSLLFEVMSLLWLIANGVWIAVFLYLYCFWYPIKWKKLSFCLTEKILYINNGVVYTHRRFIRLQNVQFVSTYQSPLMKLAGLASVIIRAPGVSMYLPSLYKEDAESLYEALTVFCLTREEEGGIGR
ncbi:PH domain-containing protein [Zongyangia hominis]|uniref:PH domain-containing protein n=1 Tax=Zongyangia hominis TaxID=2763677 RepID=A0A926IBY3_9FIRM|nr:PH domain-containing protein [Zongyangia hominis]MBC8570662.1 PH domain-containing protein [Zongyangia hominis]